MNFFVSTSIFVLAANSTDLLPAGTKREIVTRSYASNTFILNLSVQGECYRDIMSPYYNFQCREIDALCLSKQRIVKQAVVSTSSDQIRFEWEWACAEDTLKICDNNLWCDPRTICEYPSETEINDEMDWELDFNWSDAWCYCPNTMIGDPMRELCHCLVNETLIDNTCVRTTTTTTAQLTSSSIKFTSTSNTTTKGNNNSETKNGDNVILILLFLVTIACIVLIFFYKRAAKRRVAPAERVVISHARIDNSRNNEKLPTPPEELPKIRHTKNTMYVSSHEIARSTE